jgi:NhaP-type Na+/H+ or K+/H+ antiporter
MVLFELIIALLLAGAVLATLSRRISVPYPTLLALAGAAAAFMPGTPAITLEPGLALALFVAPVLLDAAFDASPRDLRDNWLPIGALAIVAVGLTVVAVAVVARLLVPDLPWAAAVGAIVAPPDASAATTVLNQVRPPHRLLVILEGESLLNDTKAC